MGQICKAAVSGSIRGQGSFVDQQHVVKKYVDRDNGAKDTMKQAEEILHPAENFFHAIGIDPPLMDSVAKKAWKCDACPRYNHECEACWKCHPCTCPGKDRRPLTVEQAIVRIMDSLWTQYDDERKGAGAVKEIFRTYHDAHEKGKAIVNTVRKKTVLGNINRNVACAIRLVLEKYAPVVRKNLDEDRVNETPDEEDIRTLGDRVWKVMRESIFTFHDCACNAHREAFRVQMADSHRGCDCRAWQASPALPQQLAGHLHRLPAPLARGALLLAEHRLRIVDQLIHHGRRVDFRTERRCQRSLRLRLRLLRRDAFERGTEDLVFLVGPRRGWLRRLRRRSMVRAR